MTGRRSGSTSRSSSSRPKKRLGQHFLSDLNILGRIVDAAEVQSNDTVVEVGPGRGALTSVLLDRGARVVAVEVDEDLAGALTERFRDDGHFTLVSRDILDVSPDELLEAASAAGPYVVVANLPYNIAAPTIRMFLESGHQPLRMVVMVQLEVAQSICSKPPRMTLLGVATQTYGAAEIVMKVAPGAFFPPPKVESAVVRIEVADCPRVDAPLDAFFRIARAGFGNPRKMLRNSLSFGLHVKQDVVDAVMREAGVSADLRPQVLSLEDWAAITRAWVGREQR